MSDLFETRSFLDTLRDWAYDTVLHVGDTASQFLWDVIAGPDEGRQQAYTTRQRAMQERKAGRTSPYPQEQKAPAAEIATSYHPVSSRKPKTKAKKQTKTRKRAR